MKAKDKLRTIDLEAVRFALDTLIECVVIIVQASGLYIQELRQWATVAALSPDSTYSELALCLLVRPIYTLRKLTGAKK